MVFCQALYIKNINRVIKIAVFVIGNLDKQEKICYSSDIRNKLMTGLIL